MRIDLAKMRDLIAANPGIRTVQISDKLDCDMEDLVEALDAEARRGVIVKYQVTAPNNRKASAYRLTDVPDPVPPVATPEVMPEAKLELTTTPRPVVAPPSAQNLTLQLPPTVIEQPAAPHTEGDQMQTTSYTPRPGTKIALAVAALLDGPMNCVQLGVAMDAQPKSVHAMLATARENNLIVALKDKTGLAHFALAGMPLDERFPTSGNLHTSKPKRIIPAKPAPVSHSAGPKKSCAPVAAKSPKSFLAGLLSNGELLVSDGVATMTLCVDHTNQLITYLDKARSRV